jgi:ankyrin repeat protein
MGRSLPLRSLLCGALFVLPSIAPVFATASKNTDEHLSLDERQAIVHFLGAAQDGDLETVRARLDAGMPVDAMLPPKDPRYPYTVRTALEAAAVYARMNVVQLLLERGAKLRRHERYGVLAASLHTIESSELLAALVAHAGPGIDLDADFGPALVRAAANGALGEVDYLLDIGVDPDYRNRHEPWDDPSIVRASLQFGVIERLLDAGADPMGGDIPYRWSALLPAAEGTNAALVRRLLDLGIDPQVRGKRGNALSLASCSVPRTVRPSAERAARINEVVRMLIAAGTDPNVSSVGRTPLRCAEDSHNAELAAVLGAAGGRSHESLWVRAKRGVWMTAMSLAVMLGGM